MLLTPLILRTGWMEVMYNFSESNFPSYFSLALHNRGYVIERCVSERVDRASVRDIRKHETFPH